MNNNVDAGQLFVKSNEEYERISSNILPDRHATDEEFQNFMHRVTEVEKIVKQLASTDVSEQVRGMALADRMLDSKDGLSIPDPDDLKVISSRTQINKYREDDLDPDRMSQESFKRSVEKDAQKRAEDRKARNERAETYKRIGNSAFREGDYEKARTYFTRALERRKDSAVLWNNRALASMKLGHFDNALSDCEWALKVNENNIKALLNSAKCHKFLGNRDKCREFIALAKDRNPRFLSYISEFEKNLEKMDDEDNLID